MLETAQGHGIASALLSKLASLAEEAGYWTLQSHVISANIASLALHKKAGFREVGYRERYGAIGGTWHNVILNAEARWREGQACQPKVVDERSPRYGIFAV